MQTMRTGLRREPCLAGPRTSGSRTLVLRLVPSGVWYTYWTWLTILIAPASVLLAASILEFMKRIWKWLCQRNGRKGSRTDSYLNSILIEERSRKGGAADDHLELLDALAVLLEPCRIERD